MAVWMSPVQGCEFSGFSRVVHLGLGLDKGQGFLILQTRLKFLLNAKLEQTAVHVDVSSVLYCTTSTEIWLREWTRLLSR